MALFARIVSGSDGYIHFYEKRIIRPCAFLGMHYSANMTDKYIINRQPSLFLKKT